MSDYCRVSEALYVGLCRHIGTPTEVTIRREVMDMWDMMDEMKNAFNQRVMCSGSFKEGFRFKSSDRDFMMWYPCIKVIAEISQSSLYDLSKHTIVLFEDTDTPPGYVRLRRLSTPRHQTASSSDFQISDGTYISNSEWRQLMFSILSLNKFEKLFNSIRIRGPSAAGFSESVEIDNVFCLHSFFGSRLMCDLKKRCAMFNWPSNILIEDFLKNGCHFVPVGSKISGNENELEWRISFSLAEQKLVYSMSHTQFMCYGLLKIFLKEVVNRDKEEPILCSYFVKTTMFWQIQIGHITWNPNDLLDCFWECFKYLLSTVLRGKMTDFFIPQNNMFASKLVTSQGARSLKNLKEELIGYYEDGASCLLKSPTLRSIILPYLSDIGLRIQPSVGHELSLAELDSCIAREIFDKSFTSCNDPRNCDTFLTSLFSLSQLSLTEYQLITIQSCTAEALVKAAFLYLSTCKPDCTNKKFYKVDRLICNLLKLACKLGSVSQLLYLAMYYYRVYKNREALKVILEVKSWLSQPYLVYKPDTIDKERYCEFVAGWSLSKRFMKVRTDNIRLCEELGYIQELYHEQHCIQDPSFDIPLNVMVDMLSVLCNYRLGNRSQCLQSLKHLKTLLLDDDGRYVPLDDRDISWQILGICQHVVGDLLGAMQSYEESQRQKPVHGIQEATSCRRLIAFYQLLKSNSI